MLLVLLILISIMLLFYVIWFFVIKKPNTLDEEPQTIKDIFTTAEKNRTMSVKNWLKYIELCQNDINNEYCESLRGDVNYLSEAKFALKKADELVKIITKKPVDKTKFCDVISNYEGFDDDVLELVFEGVTEYQQYLSEIPSDLPC